MLYHITPYIFLLGFLLLIIRIRILGDIGLVLSTMYYILEKIFFTYYSISVCIILTLYIQSV